MKKPPLVSARNRSASDYKVCDSNDGGNCRQGGGSSLRVGVLLLWPLPLQDHHSDTHCSTSVMKQVTVFLYFLPYFLRSGCRFCVLSVSLCWSLNSQALNSRFGKVLLRGGAAARPPAQAAHHWMLLLSSVPFASDMFIFPMDRPTWLTPSLRGGMRSLMRSRPLASSKLEILCWAENPRMAAGRKTNKQS